MKKLLLLLCIPFLSSCWGDNPGDDREAGKFLNEVVPLTEFNSEYDDYNMNLPLNKHGHSYLMFSSKRQKKDVFNLVYYPVRFSYDDRLQLSNAGGEMNLDYVSHYALANPLAERANGDFNVYGPKVLSFQYDLIQYERTNDLALFYADDSQGNMEIKYFLNQNHQISGPFKFDLINSSKDDGYPSFSREGDRIYFSSNRDGNFDIYELSIPRAEREKITIESLVNPAKYQLRKVEELSTPFDDKCPYIQDDMMVFVSNRPGGIGGQDIYYSRYENGKWTQPVNAGDRINTSHNEYRPIVPELNNFNYKMVFFSSDRPGGKGGYDLYMTGLVEEW